MTTEFLKSNSVTNMDAIPVIINTTGEGAPGALMSQSDTVTTTTSGGVGSTYRMARIPTTAKIKHVFAYVGDVDSNAIATWKGDFNMAFSDATNDGTPPSLQGLIPTSSNNGTTTTVASYSSPNILFGQITAANSGAVTYKEITFNGTFTPANANDDLWDVFGFANNQGVPQDPGGFFDLLVYVSTAAATAHAGVLGVEIEYVR